MKILKEKIITSLLIMIILLVTVIVFPITKINTIEKNLNLFVEKEITLFAAQSKLSNNFQSQLYALNAYSLNPSNSYKKQFFDMKEDSEAYYDLLRSKDAFSRDLITQMETWNKDVVAFVFSEHSQTGEALISTLRDFIFPEGEKISAMYIEELNFQQEQLNASGEKLLSKFTNLKTALNDLLAFVIIVSSIGCVLLVIKLRRFNAAAN